MNAPESFRQAHRPAIWAWAVVILIAMVLVSGVTMTRVAASVTLKSFKATRQGDGSIRVDWETATELDTLGFRVYRSESPNTVGQVVATQAATGDSVTGATYSYTDPASELIAGRNYYYRLEEFTSGGSSWHGPVNPGGTNATSTRAVWVAGTATSTDPPTATRRYTNTPVPPTPIPATPVPQAQPQPVQPPAPVAPPPGPGVVTTPTGLPALEPLPALPTETPVIPTQTPIPSPTETLTATPSNTPRPTPTPTLTAAPVVFSARSEASEATATIAETPAAPAGGSSTGGEGGLPVGLVAGAALAVGVVLGLVAALSMRRSRPS